MSSSTGGGSLGSGSEDMDIESSDCDSSIVSEFESDLEESFDFEDSASQSQSSVQTQEACNTETVQQETAVSQLLSTGGNALFVGSKISTLQSYLLIFQYAVRHGLTTKAFTELLQLLSVHLPQDAKNRSQPQRFFCRRIP